MVKITMIGKQIGKDGYLYVTEMGWTDRFLNIIVDWPLY